MSAKKRVLVTGAGGFIGRHGIEPLRAAGYDVYAVFSNKPVRANEPAGVQARRVDLLDPAQIDSLIESVRPTHLLHFAWIATPGLYWTSAENYRWLEASQYLLRSFKEHGGKRAVMAGSCAEYDWSRVGDLPRAHEPDGGCFRHGGQRLRQVQDGHAAGPRGVWARASPFHRLGADFFSVRAR